MIQNTLSLTFIGAAGTVTGSKTLLEFNGQKILIDCGLFQGLKHLRQENWKPLDLESEITDVLLTHAHLDHCGYLPRLVKQGFKGRIYCTPITAELAEIVLLDSAKIQEEDAESANRRQYSKHKPALPLYDTEDVKKCLALFYPLELSQWAVLGPDLRFVFHPNGHIPGSAFIELHAEKKKLVFSGDVGRLKPLLMQPPNHLPEADFLLLESTYGNRLHTTLSPFDQLEGFINKGLKRGGNIYIPSFAVERSQEIVYLLLKLMQAKRIPMHTIYLDSPMAASVTKVLRNYYPQFLDPEVRYLMDQQLEVISDYRASQAVVALQGPKIIIAGSGMITGGRILHHLEEGISNPKNMVVLPGFQSVGTRGHSLSEGANEIKFFGKFHQVKAEVVKLEGMSSHADREELVAWLKKADVLPKRIVLNHGEQEASHSLRVKLEQEFGIPTRVAQPNMELIFDFDPL